MIPKTKTQWALGAAVVVSVIWLYFVRDFKPLLAVITSFVAYSSSFAISRQTMFSGTSYIPPVKRKIE